MEHSAGLILVALMAVLVYCEAHGGSLHSASHPNYDIKTVAATCTEWVEPGTSSVAVSKLAVGGRRLTAGKIAVEGIANMTVRMSKNCTGDYTTSVLINVTIAEGTTPLNKVLINGSITTGSCAAGGGSLYMLDAAEGMDDHNLLFFKPNATDTEGRLVGSFANDGVVDTNGTGSAKSLVLYRAGLPISCCTLKITTPAKGYASYLAPMGLTNCTAANTTTTEEPLGMTMDGMWMACQKINGTYQMDHGGSYAKCLEYKNGTRASVTTTAAANTTTTGNTTSSSAAAPTSPAKSLVVRCVVGLLGAGLLWL